MNAQAMWINSFDRCAGGGMSKVGIVDKAISSLAQQMKLEYDPQRCDPAL